MNDADELAKLNELRVQGILTQKEFDRKKHAILRGSKRGWKGWWWRIPLAGVLVWLVFQYLPQQIANQKESASASSNNPPSTPSQPVPQLAKAVPAPSKTQDGDASSNNYATFTMDTDDSEQAEAANSGPSDDSYTVPELTPDNPLMAAKKGTWNVLPECDSRDAQEALNEIMKGLKYGDSNPPERKTDVLLKITNVKQTSFDSSSFTRYCDAGNELSPKSKGTLKYLIMFTPNDHSIWVVTWLPFE
jgi:cytoskeletal protein RodZ